MVCGARSTSKPEDVQATFCAALVDEWVRLGAKHAVIAPGSRSTPMALAITDRADVAVHVVHDERAAAFVALGLGVEGERPLLLCTSGTAAANFFPAVVEAGLSDVPMIVITADRPSELRGVGAPQTIDQLRLYGDHVRWFHDAPVAAETDSGTWRLLASDAWAHADAGPVQLNLAFREPLIGIAGELPPVGDTPRPNRSDRSARSVDAVPGGIVAERGVIVVGGRSGLAVDQVAALHRATRWPIIADPISGMRQIDGVVTAADALLRDERFVADHRPDVIVRIGRPASSKVLAQWTARTQAMLVQVGGPGRIDPDHNVTAVCDIVDLLATLDGGRSTPSTPSTPSSPSTPSTPSTPDPEYPEYPEHPVRVVAAVMARCRSSRRPGDRRHARVVDRAVGTGCRADGRRASSPRRGAHRGVVDADP